MGWCYDFYKVYKTKQEDINIWNGKSDDDLPKHLRFLCAAYDYEDDEGGIKEIKECLLPINMYVDNNEYQGYLATLYPIALFGKDAFMVAYETPRDCWYHFVRLTNSKARKMLKRAFNDSFARYHYSQEVLSGYLGKQNKYKQYPGKLRHVVFYHHQ